MDVRLIVDPPAAGAVNMSIDEALLETADRGATTLRFYAWEPATLSLGYFQNYAERRGHLASSKLDVVRRSTGGGAIVHDRELTYSFVTPISQRFSTDHQQLVQAFHASLCESLANWQIVANLYNSKSATAKAVSPPSDASFLCFQRRANDDVVLGVDKIAGSAQRRRRHALLQHGSVLLGRSDAAPELPGVNDLCSSFNPPKADGLIEEWIGRIGARFDFRFAPSELTLEEQRSAELYRKTRYQEQSWLMRR